MMKKERKEENDEGKERGKRRKKIGKCDMTSLGNDITKEAYMMSDV